MKIEPRRLGTTIRWASLLAPGYCVPTIADIHSFVGFGVNDILVDAMVTRGTHFTERIRNYLIDNQIPVRTNWDRFKGTYNPQGPIVYSPRSSMQWKDWSHVGWEELISQFEKRGLAVERETEGDLWALERQLRNARLVIGVDSGPLHLADYMGIPVVGLYGHTVPSIHGPLGECSSTICNRLGVRLISSEEVYSTASRLLENKK